MVLKNNERNCNIFIDGNSALRHHGRDFLFLKSDVLNDFVTPYIFPSIIMNIGTSGNILIQYKIISFTSLHTGTAASYYVMNNTYLGGLYLGR